MPEIALVSTPVLPHPPLQVSSTLRIEALAEGHVLHVLANAGSEVGPDQLAALGDGTPHAVRSYAPGQWFIVGDARIAPSLIRERAAGLGTAAAIADQSHGRVRLALSGPGARDLLARGCGVDFSARMFAVGASAATLYNHIGIHVTRTGDDRFEILVLRSFAQSLWEDLATNSGGTH